MAVEVLSLTAALRENRLDEFIRQETKRGVGAGNRADFDEAVRRLATRPRSAGRTSRFPSRDGSSGT